MGKIKTTFLIFPILLSLFACKEKESKELILYGQEFNPIQLNATWTYLGDSIIYDNFSADSSIRIFYLKDSIIELTIDQTDTLATLERSIKYFDSAAYVYQQTYVIRKNNWRNISYLNAIAICELTYPIQLNMKWNGNQFNNLAPQIFELSEIKSRIFQNQSVSSVQVIQQNNKNLIREDYEESIYGKDFGKLYYRLIGVDKDISSGEITSGISVTLNLINYNH